MHPVIAGLVALLILLAIASVVLLHRKARAALADHDPRSEDSDAILVDPARSRSA
ncbi:MAG: hypothetical protein KIT60_22795 [Burkholderiaceae bacterium]|nr:hypothetical protein [Burkholderiaceae bacterium]